MNNKLILGTAQFGMDYGINNTRGKIPQTEVFEILNRALEAEIDVLDTASAYGESEEVIGVFIKKYKKILKIVSKFNQSDTLKISAIFNSSLEKLGIDKFYGYLVHSFGQYKENPDIWGVLRELKSSGKIEKIGFSLYSPCELDYLFENKLDIDIVQLPYNVFDHRFESYFPILKEKGIEIHVRSAFLQGLVFMQPNNLPEYLVKAKDYVRNLQSISKESGIPISALCLDFILVNPCVDRLIMGVDSLKHLNENLIDIDSFKKIEGVYYSKLDKLAISDENLILPFRWTK